MPKDYTITVSDEVNNALVKKASDDGITVQELIDSQLIYYIGCALYDSFPQVAPVNTPGLSIPERIEVYAAGVNSGEAAARAKVDEILASH